MDGGSRVAQVLKARGVPFVFCLAGGHISPILVAAKKAGIRVIDTRHEVNAVFAADAVSRLTGVPGVAVVTAGPGVANTVTAIKNAQLAQSPLVLIGGATGVLLRGRGALQDIDQLSLLRPHVKYAARPSWLKDVIPALEEAFDQAVSGVPGPTFVELAVDLLYEEAVVKDMYLSKASRSQPSLGERALNLYLRSHLGWLFAGASRPAFHPPAPRAALPIPAPKVSEAARLLAEARKPLMILGSQVMLHPDRAQDLVGAVERLGVPVYLSGMSRGLLGASHPLQLRHKRRNALKEADVVLLAGAPCDFRLEYGTQLSRATVIGVNLSSEDLNKNRRPSLGVQGDPLAFLLEVAAASADTPPARAEWLASLQARDAAREAEIASLAAEPSSGLNPLRVCQAVEQQLTPGSVLIGDGGDFVGTAAYIVRPRGPYAWLDPGVFGTLGVGAGFALGARLVNPEADIWLLYGDGAAGFSLMELDTFVRHGLSVVAVVGNDAGWTQIARDQVGILGDDVACRLAYTDYHKVAEGLGAVGFRVEEEGALEPTLAEALRVARAGKPVLVNVILGRSDFRKGSISL